jgi:hypothetical protein
MYSVRRFAAADHDGGLTGNHTATICRPDTDSYAWHACRSACGVSRHPAVDHPCRTGAKYTTTSSTRPRPNRAIGGYLTHPPPPPPPPCHTCVSSGARSAGPHGALPCLLLQFAVEMQVPRVISHRRRAGHEPRWQIRHPPRRQRRRAMHGPARPAARHGPITLTAWLPSDSTRASTGNVWARLPRAARSGKRLCTRPRQSQATAPPHRAYALFLVALPLLGGGACKQDGHGAVAISVAHRSHTQRYCRCRCRGERTQRGGRGCCGRCCRCCRRHWSRAGCRRRPCRSAALEHPWPLRMGQQGNACGPISPSRR